MGVVVGTPRPGARSVSPADAGDAHRDPSRLGGWPADVLIVAVLTVPVVISVLRHHQWRDELQAWAIAASNHSLSDLFAALRYEGHPPLWYLLLAPITRLTSDPRAMQLISVGAFVLTAALVVRLSPWRRWTQVLFLAGYFPIFEYSVIARSYSLGLPLTFVLCALTWPRRMPRNYPAIALIATLLALTSVVDALCAVAIVVGMLVDEAIRSGDGPPRWRRLRQPALLWSLGVATVVVGAVAYAVRPASDVVTSAPPSSATQRFGGELARALIPVPNVARSWWSTSWPVNHLGATVTGVVAGIFFLGLVWSVRRSVPAMVTMVIGTLAVGGLGVLTDQAALRLGGHMLLSAAVASWAFRRGLEAEPVDATTVRAGREQSAVFGFLLALQLVATVVALPQAWTTRFSGIDETVARLRPLSTGTLISVEPEGLAGGVAGALGRAVFVPSSRLDQRYTIYDRVGSAFDQVHLSDDQIIARTRARSAGRPAVVVLDHEYRGRPGAVSLISRYDHAVIYTENVFTYRILGTGR